MRKGRYRYQMIEEEKLKQWAYPLSVVFEIWKKEVEAGELASWEFVARYLLIFVFLNRPMEKWSKRKDLSAEETNRKDKMYLQVSDAFAGLFTKEQLLKWNDSCTWVYGDLRQLRGVPEKVLKSLRGWRDCEFDLFVLHYVPSAEELLKFQVQGKRCVTALVTEEQIPIPVEEGRDVWSFCLHDLLHASHFFGDPKQNLSQRYLASFFLKAWQYQGFQNWLAEDQKFALDFTYVAADMNAHPVYIFMSFYAKVLECYKRQNGYQENELLSSADECRWSLFWQTFLFDITMSTEAVAVLGGMSSDHGHFLADEMAKLDVFLRSQIGIDSVF